MANKTQSFDERINAEDTAEDYFKDYCRKEEIKFYDYGIKDHEFGNKFYKVKRIIRNTPDYIVMSNDTCLVEVKGCWDNISFKEGDLNSYKVWNKYMRLYYFFYSVYHKEHRWIPHNDLMNVIPLCETGYHNDPNPFDDKMYYKILWSMIK